MTKITHTHIYEQSRIQKLNWIYIYIILVNTYYIHLLKKNTGF